MLCASHVPALAGNLCGVINHDASGYDVDSFWVTGLQSKCNCKDADLAMLAMSSAVLAG